MLLAIFCVNVEKLENYIFIAELLTREIRNLDDGLDWIIEISVQNYPLLDNFSFIFVLSKLTINKKFGVHKKI